MRRLYFRVAMGFYFALRADAVDTDVQHTETRAAS